MNKRQSRIERIRAVELEYRAALSAIGLLELKLKAVPNWGDSEGWKGADVDRLNDNIESTYLIRLYAEFEAGLRDAWRRKTLPSMKDLLVSMASKNISQDCLDQADEVRIYRNSIVHEGELSNVKIISLAEVRSRLCSFFSRLPMNW